MGVREFKDESGREWRAWEIRPEAIHPATKAEDYLADCYITGWIVFETKACDEKRRLCPYPIRWNQASDDGMRDFLKRAEVVSPQRMREERVERRRPVTPKTRSSIDADVTDLDVVRSFK